MRRLVVLLVALLAAVSGATACNDYDGHRHHHGHSRSHADCEAQTTCGTCTPVLGCGWCFSSAGGTCVDGPDDCPNGTTSFTWDPPGCGASDAGAPAVDAAPSSDASSDARVLADVSVGTPEPRDAAPPADANADANHD